MEKFLQQFQHLKIQLEEITSATNNFDDQNNCIGRGGYGKVYKGEVSHSKGRSVVAIKRLDRTGKQGIPEFLKEITMLSDYKHENVISLLGFCCEGGEMILVYELASRGSLDRYLNSPHLTWRQRLKICLDAAKGLRYLHDPRETHRRLIHCDVKSANILLDDQWIAKVADVGLSIIGSANEQHSLIVTAAAGTVGYIDPVYWMTNTLTKESDVYSFGVVLFEVLCGTLWCTYSNGRVQQNLVPWWIENYKKKKLYDIIFKNLTIPPMDQSTFEIFSDIAYRCLNESREDRPNMDEVVIALTTALRHQEAFLQQFQLLKIPLVEITSATNHFNDENYIGGGAFGKVYKGEVSHSNGRSMVAIKHLDPKHEQGNPEFLKHITTLSRYKHENLISLLGFCHQGDEMILIYEYAPRGSLDRYLNSPHLTWSQRLRICLGAAKGLSYLHDPGKRHQRLIHCDVKSANILLDEQWNGKVYYELSKMNPTNEQNSLIVTVAAGTPGYCDPQYSITHTLTKESDVYSFGVVLFEVLCGTLCYTLDSKDHVKEILVPTWIKSYEPNKLKDIILQKSNNKRMHESVLNRFLGIAYQCLKESREDRPEMADIVTELESALNIHELLQNEEFIGKWNEQLHEYQQMIRTAKPPLNYKSEDELIDLMSKGVLLNGGKTWFSLNKKGEHCEMISIGECLGSDAESYLFSSKNNSRFAVGTYSIYTVKDIIILHVRSQFLSPGITYTVNLVFKFKMKKDYKGCELISLKYRLQGERKSSISYLAYEREDGWWACELYQFTCDYRIVHFQILFEGYHNQDYLKVEGIEFQPLENVEHIDEKQLILDSDANLEEKLPVDYKDIMKRSKNRLQWTTKEEAYSIICKGFLISDDETKRDIWFCLDKNGKKCHMLSAALIWRWKEKVSLPESRFGEAIQWGYDNYIIIRTKLQSQLVSSKTTYACYLVYKLPTDQSGFEAPVKVQDTQCDSGDKICYIYLTSPQTPVIRPKAGQNTHNPLNRLKIKSLPQQRNDGWIEVQIWEFQAATTVDMELLLRVVDQRKISGLIIEGIEFRPI